MVAIVSGNSLGLSLTSLATLGQRGVAGSATHGRNGEAVYVNAANGNLVLQDRDDYLVGRGLSAAALRTYNSQGQLSDDNGDNWSTGVFAQQIRLTGARNTVGSTLTRTDRDGAQAIYSYDTASGTYVSSEGSGAFDSITYDSANSQYVWRDGSSGLQERYESAATGRLMSSSDPQGNTLTYSYTGDLLTLVTDASGETLHFDYSGNNLTQVRTVSAANVTTTRTRYDYDTSNRLWRVTTDLTPEDNSDSDGQTYLTTYTYDGSSNRVETITQTDGTSLSFGYTEINGRWHVATVTDALGHSTTFDYDGASTRITDALGHDIVMTTDAQGRLSEIQAPAVGGVSQTNTFAYNNEGDLIQLVDGRSLAVDMEYDSRGNQTLQRDAAGNTVTRTYDSRNQLVTETVYLTADPDGAGSGAPADPLTTRYVYDAGAGNLLRFVLSAEGRVTEHRYNAYGERTASIQYGGAAYGVASLGQTAVPTEAQMSSWVSVQDRTLSTRTDMAYDYRGQLRTTTTYTSVDLNGAGVADATSSVTQYVYDQAGQLLNTISPANGSTFFTYDGFGRVLTSTDALGRTTVTVYDDANNTTEVTLVNGLITTSTYDDGGRLVSVLQSTETASDLGRTRYFYDANNRLVMTQDPTGVRQWMLYDDAGRKVADVDGDGSLTEYSYNANNQLTRTVAYADAVDVINLVDGAGNPTLLSLGDIRPAAGPYAEANIKTWQAYDAAGRLVKTVDPAGGVTIFSYDGASRLIKQRRLPDALPLAQREALGASPEASAIAPPEWFNWERRTHNYYSADGLLIGYLDEENYYTQNAYDAAGRLISTTRYASQMEGGLIADDYVAPVVIQNGDPTPSSTYVRVAQDTSPSPTGADQVTRFFYNSKGQLAAQVDAENYLTDYVYDANGNLATTIRYAEPLTVAVTAATRLAELPRTADPENQITTSVYDNLNRLSFQTNAEGTVTAYQYDNVGNLVSTTAAYGQPEARTLNARFDVQGRLVAQLSAEGVALLDGNQTQAEIDALWDQYAVTHTYDASGRRTSTTDQNRNTTVFYYDVDGRLTYTINALGEIAEAHYNALGQLDLSVRYGTRISSAGLAGGLATTAIVDAISALRNDAIDSRVSNQYDGGVNRLRYSREFTGHYDHALTIFNYNAYGEVELKVQAADWNNPRYELYEYDRRGLTTQIRVTDNQNLPTNPTTTYAYDAFGRLCRTNANGRQSDQRYDRLGRVIQTIDAGGASGSSTYDAFSRIRTQTNSLGQVTEYWYSRADRSQTVLTPEGIEFITTHTRHGQTYSVTSGRRAGPGADPIPYTTFYEYDLDGNLTGTRKGQITTSQTFDRANRLETTTDANGNEVHYTYDAANRVLSVTVDPTGLQLTTNYRYDAKGQAAWTQDPNGVWTQTQYNLRGDVIAVTVDPTRGPDWVEGQPDDNADGLSLTTAYIYDALGSRVSVTDPAGTITLYSYDPLGRRVSERVDPSGLNITRHYTYDSYNNVVASTDDNGDVTRYIYDSNNRLTFTIDGAGGISRNEYDGEGRLTRSTRYAQAITPATLAGLPLQVSFDDIQLYIVTTPGRDAIQANRYDRDDRLRFTVDGTGAVTEFRYDADGNVAERIGYANPISLAGWDGSTDPAVVAAPNFDQHIRTTYDALNRATYVADGVGSVTRNFYDDNGNLIRQIQYATSISSTTSPDAVATEDPGNRVSEFRYDAANRLTWSADAVGSVTFREYDGNGNLTVHKAYAAQVTPGTEPSAVQTSSADRITSSRYDSVNRVVYSTDAQGYVTKTSYDTLARQTTKTLHFNKPITPGGDPIPWAMDQTEVSRYDAAGRLSSVTDAAQATERYYYDGVGNRTGFWNKKSMVWNYTYDAAGRLLTETAPRVSVSSLGADAFGNLTAGTTEEVALVTRCTYDGLGNLTSRTEADGRAEARTTHYAYDAVGRQIRVTYPPVDVYVDEGAALAFNGQAGSASASVNNRALTTLTFYDALGNAVINIDVAGNTSHKVYDTMGRVIYAVDAMGYLTSYDLNAFGEVETLTRYGESISLPSSTPTSAAERLTAVDAYYAALTNNPETKRTLATEYDKLGRTTRVTESAAYTYDSSAATSDTRYDASHGKVTRSDYNAFGDLVQQAVSKNLRDNTWSYTAYYYNIAGQQVREVDSAGYMTDRQYDAAGNLTQVTEYANKISAPAEEGSWVTPVAPPSPNLDDRITQYAYDRCNRKGAEIRFSVEFSTAAEASAGTSTRSFVVTQWAYDALGNVIRTLDAAGGETYSYYDALGRVTAVAAPARTSTTDGSALTPLTLFRRDAYGNVLAKIELANGAAAATLYNGVSSQSHAAQRLGYTAAAFDAVNDRVTYSRYDSHGHVTQTTDATGASRYSSYNERGELAKTWQGVTSGSPTAAPGANGTFTIDSTIFTAYRYDKLGRLTHTITPAPTESLNLGASTRGSNIVIDRVLQSAAGVIDSALDYNAFGEVISKGVSDVGGGSMQEYFQYDNAGRLWRTNAGDGVDKVMLYDLQGRATAVITSSGGISLAGDLTAQTVAGWNNVRRTDYVYDALGHVKEEIAPQRMVSEDGVTIRNLSANASIVGSSAIHYVPTAFTWATDETGTHQVPTAWGMRWDNTQNVVNLSWTDLSQLGTGDVRVTLHYQTQSYVTPAIPPSGEYPGEPESTRASVPATYSWVFTNAAGVGATLRWNDPAAAVDGGISAITRLVVDKKDSQGNWITSVIDRSAWGDYGTVIELPTPQAGAVGDLALYIHQQGTPDTPANWTSVGVNFGDAWRFDFTPYAGTYDYKIVRTPTDGSAQDVLRTGQITGGAVLNDSQQLVDPSQRPVIHMTSDRWGNVLTRSDARDATWVTRFTYNANNQVVDQFQPVADAGQGVPHTRYYYDALGQQVGMRDANGNLNRWSYDAAGQVQAEHHADGGQVVYSYNAFGNKVEMRDAIAATPDPTVDAATRAKHITRYTYDGVGRLLTTVHGQTDVFTSYRSGEDGGGGVVLTYQGAQNTVERNVYDQAGRMISQTNGANQTTRYRYDLAGHVIERIDPMLFRTKTYYDRFGHKAAEADANNNFATWSYDYFGKIRRHTDLGGAVFSYVYDDGFTGQLLSQSNTRGQNISYSYDAAGQLIQTESLIAPNVWNTSTTVYDLAGNHVRETTRQGGYYNIYQDSHMAYDALGRLRDVRDGRAHIEMSYDAVGNRTRIQTHVNVMQPNSNQADDSKNEDRFFTYDSMNRQRIVDGVGVRDNVGNYLKDDRGNYRADISLTQGREITYDFNGNRKTERKGGRQVTTTQTIVRGFYAYTLYSNDGETRRIYPQEVGPDGSTSVNRLFAESDIGYDPTFGNPYIISLSQEYTYYVDGIEAGPNYSETTSSQANDAFVVNTYSYDAKDRLTTIAQDGVAANFNYYDAADRLLQSGLGRGIGGHAGSQAGASQEQIVLMNTASTTPGSAPGAGFSDETTQNVYDANGRLRHQIVRSPRSDNLFDRVRYLDNDYDNVGNVVHTNYEIVKEYNVQYYFNYSAFDSYKLNHATGTASNGNEGSSLLGGALGGLVSSALGLPGLGEYLGHTGRIFGGIGGFEGGSGTTQNHYDVNGFLASTTYSEAPTRRYVNTAQGQMLYANTAGDVAVNTGSVLRTVIANGENLGTFGVSGTQQVADFNFSYQALTGQQGGVSSYVVQAGDTLRSIARTVYGDETLWYRIAESNGLAGDTDVRAGQSLSIPSQLGTIHNNANTFKHFDQRQIAGDSTPTLGPPGQACGGNGQMIVTVVAVVVTVVVAYFTVGTGLTWTNAIWAAAGAAGGNLAGQVVANELGMQDGVNWKSVAASAVGGAMTVGLGLTGGFGFTGGAVVRAAVANAATQGISVMVGWQEKFDWKGVAASAMGAAVGQGVGGALGINDPGFKNLSFGDQFGARLMTGVAGGLASAVARGGKVALEQVVVDAFGNALGESLARGSDPTRDPSSKYYLNEMDRQDDAYRPGYNYNYRNGSDVESDGVPTQQQLRAMQAGRGPLTATAAQRWAANDEASNWGFADSTAWRKEKNLEALFDSGSAPSGGGESTAKYFRAPSMMSVEPMEAPRLKFDLLGNVDKVILPGSYGGDYTSVQSFGQENWEGGSLVLPRLELTHHRGWLTRADAFLQGIQGRFDDQVQQRQDMGADAHARGDYLSAAGAALRYLPDRVGADIAKGIVGLPRLFTSNTMFPGLVDAASHPVTTAQSAYGAFRGMPLQDQVIAGVELFGPAALKVGNPAVTKLNSLPVLGADMGNITARGLSNLTAPRTLGTQRGAASIELLSGGLVREAMPQGASPRIALQGAVDQAVTALHANPRLASDLMSPGSYQHLVNRTGLADASYGKAVERLTARIVREDPGLSATLQYQSRPFVATPDFFGYEGHNLHLLDITTERSIPAHLLRPYGPATQYVTHPGLPPGLVFE